jgi:tRNA modification GTPase
MHGSRKWRALDQAVVTVYEAPHSFTGEDVVEISSHGGHVVPASIIAALIGSGAEKHFLVNSPRRAVLNGKLDIVQAEAIGDLIDARSSSMQQVALGQLEGGLSSRIGEVRREHNLSRGSSGVRYRLSRRR